MYLSCLCFLSPCGKKPIGKTARLVVLLYYRSSGEMINVSSFIIMHQWYDNLMPNSFILLFQKEHESSPQLYEKIMK